MRIGIQTWGSEGDIRPMLALGHGLVQRGHHVELVYTDIRNRQYEGVASALGMTARSVVTPVVLDEAESYRLAIRAMRSSNPLISGRVIIDHFFKPAEARMREAAIELVDRSDLLVGHLLMHHLRAAAERADKPEVSVTFAHTMVPSRHIRPTGLPRLGPWGNAAGWRLARFALNRLWLSDVNKFRRSLGVPPARDLLLDAWASHLLNLVAVSPVLCAAPPDWPSWNQVSGFLALPPHPHEILSPSVERFLDAGPAPLFMGFGSLMPTGTAYLSDTVTLLRQAAARAGYRAIIQAEVEPFDQDGDAIVVRRAPHAVLFPRCAAVVHHAGAGTSHSALRAGVPSVPVPHLSDQFSWAEDLHRLGVAPPGLPRRSLSAPALARRITEALAGPEMRRRAREVQGRMQGEDGIRTSARLIEEVAGGLRLSA